MRIARVETCKVHNPQVTINYFRVYLELLFKSNRAYRKIKQDFWNLCLDWEISLDWCLDRLLFTCLSSIFSSCMYCLKKNSRTCKWKATLTLLLGLHAVKCYATSVVCWWLANRDVCHAYYRNWLVKEITIVRSRILIDTWLINI